VAAVAVGYTRYLPAADEGTPAAAHDTAGYTAPAADTVAAEEVAVGTAAAAASVVHLTASVDIPDFAEIRDSVHTAPDSTQTAVAVAAEHTGQVVIAAVVAVADTVHTVHYTAHSTRALWASPPSSFSNASFVLSVPDSSRDFLRFAIGSI